MIIRFNKESIIQFFLVSLVIFSTDTFLVFANENETLKHFSFILLLVISSYFFINYFLNHRLLKADFFNLIILLVCILLTMVLKSDFSSGNIFKFFILFVGWSLSTTLNLDNFQKYFIKIMVFIASISVFSYIFSPILINLPFIPVAINTSGTMVKTLFFTNIPLVSDGIKRNWGPFWEPGVFQIYLNLAILFCLLQEKIKKSYILILVLAVCTTFSTTGYLSLFLIFSGRMLKRKFYKLELLALVGILIGTVFLFLHPQVNEVVFGKFSSSSHSFESTQSRFEGILFNIELIKNNPFFGVGVKQMVEEFNHFKISKRYYFFSNTNGLLMNYSLFGVTFGSIYFLSLLSFLKKLTDKNLDRIIFFIFLMMSLFSEPLINSLLFNMIIFLNRGNIQKIRETRVNNG